MTITEVQTLRLNLPTTSTMNASADYSAKRVDRQMREIAGSICVFGCT